MLETVQPGATAPAGLRPNAVRVLLGAAAALAAVTAMVVLTGSLGPLDRWCTGLFRHVPTGGPVHAAVVVVTWSGSIGVGVTILLLFGALLSWRRRAAGPVLATSAVTLALAASVYGLKAWVGRARPGVPVGTDPEPAFPSGHAATATVVAGTVLALLWWTVLCQHRRIAGCLAAGYVVAVGVSRLYLGVHWLSDVLAGWLVGVVLVSALLLCLTQWPRTTR
jgi:membrane-associated phospholipid phosphatase